MSRSEYIPDASEGSDVQTARMFPHSLEAEQGVLGCAMLNPRECVADCVQAFKAGKSVFYDLRHQTLYEVLVTMWDANDPIDIITLQNRLKALGLLEQVGGLAYIAGLPDQVPSAANLSYYTAIVTEKFLKRGLLRTLGESQRQAMEHSGDIGELLGQVEADVLAVGEGRMMEGQRTMRALVSTTIDNIEEMSRGVGMLRGLRTHYGYFDKKTRGLQRKKLIVVAGRPGTGKTSWAMNMAANIALIENQPVGVFSLEMDADELTFRLMCSESEVNGSNLGDGFMAQGDIPKLTRASGRLAKAPLYIDDTAGLSILELRARARRMKQRFGIKLLVIDYLQLLHSTNKKCENRQQEVADISSGCKALAKELDVPVVVLSQLNRESVKNKNRKPLLEDLRESGAIEQDADLVVLLYNPKSDDDDEDAGFQDTIRVNGLIAKHRGGPLADCEFLFKKAFTKFVDYYQNRGKEVPTAADIPTRK